MCDFEECISESGNGGGISSTIIGGEIELNGINMNKCESVNGGGIYS
jgi:hypothetical protein